MYEKYTAIPESILSDLSDLISKESFTNSNVNYFTPRSVDKAVEMIIKNANTPYKTTIKPILNVLIENTKEDAKLKSGYIWKKNEKISWLDLQKHLL